MPLTHSHRHAPTRGLSWVLALTVSYTVVEVVGGVVSGSLALLADAGHMMTDNLALVLALMEISRRIAVVCGPSAGVGKPHVA